VTNVSEPMIRYGNPLPSVDVALIYTLITEMLNTKTPTCGISLLGDMQNDPFSGERYHGRRQVSVMPSYPSTEPIMSHSIPHHRGRGYPKHRELHRESNLRDFVERQQKRSLGLTRHLNWFSKQRHTKTPPDHVMIFALPAKASQMHCNWNLATPDLVPNRPPCNLFFLGPVSALSPVRFQI
jgi:hypothetical protein